jgi:hypothetical protein
MCKKYLSLGVGRNALTKAQALVQLKLWLLEGLRIPAPVKPVADGMSICGSMPGIVPLVGFQSLHWTRNYLLDFRHGRLLMQLRVHNLLDDATRGIAVHRCPHVN